jgi:hypothetical protein
LFSNLIKIYF